jgi:hypothetical protein
MTATHTPKRTWVDPLITTLQDQNDTLRLQLYHTRMPLLTTVMYAFNNQHTTPLCACTNCCFGGRVDEHANHSSGKVDCKFQGKWEAFIQENGATWTTPQGKWPDEVDAPKFANTRCHLYMSGWKDWVFGSWGKQLDGLDDPRKSTWDKIMRSYELWDMDIRRRDLWQQQFPTLV